MTDAAKLKPFQDLAKECLALMAEGCAASLRGDEKTSIEKNEEFNNKLLSFKGEITWCELNHVKKIYDVLTSVEKICAHIFDGDDDDGELELLKELGEEIKMIFDEKYDSYDLG